jgi:hypothetical protein
MAAAACVPIVLHAGGQGAGRASCGCTAPQAMPAAASACAPCPAPGALACGSGRQSSSTLLLRSLSAVRAGADRGGQRAGGQRQARAIQGGAAAAVAVAALATLHQAAGMSCASLQAHLPHRTCAASQGCPTPPQALLLACTCGLVWFIWGHPLAYGEKGPAANMFVGGRVSLSLLLPLGAGVCDAALQPWALPCAARGPMVWPAGGPGSSRAAAWELRGPRQQRARSPSPGLPSAGQCRAAADACLLPRPAITGLGNV